MIRTVLVCDLCQREQAQGENHWFSIVTSKAPRQLMIGPVGSEATLLGENRQIVHVCGEGCAMKRFGEFSRTFS